MPQGISPTSSYYTKTNKSNQGQLRQPIYPDFTSACNFLRKEPHIACRGHRGHFEADLEAAEVIEIGLEADLEADLEAEIEAAEADLEAAEAAQGHLRPLQATQATNKPGTYGTI